MCVGNLCHSYFLESTEEEEEELSESDSEIDQVSYNLATFLPCTLISLNHPPLKDPETRATKVSLKVSFQLSLLPSYPLILL